MNKEKVKETHVKIAKVRDKLLNGLINEGEKWYNELEGNDIHLIKKWAEVDKYQLIIMILKLAISEHHKRKSLPYALAGLYYKTHSPDGAESSN